MGLCKTSNFSIFTFIKDNDLTFCTCSYSSCVYRMFEWKSLQNDDGTLYPQNVSSFRPLSEYLGCVYTILDSFPWRRENHTG